MELLTVLRPARHCNALHVTRGAELVMAQYEHDAAADTRHGNLQAVKIDDVVDLDAGAAPPTIASRLMDVCGVFDVRAVPVDADDASPEQLLASYTDGSVGLLRVEDGGVVVCVATAHPDAEMTTNATAVGKLTASTHHLGATVLFDMERPDAAPVSKWHAHDYDAWYVAHHTPTGTIITGGDDGKLRGWDSRALLASEGSDSDTECPSSTFCVRNDAGFVFVLPLADHPAHGGAADHHVLAGTYDEKIKLFDLRNMRRAVAETTVGGGAWRVRPTAVSGELVVAAMQGGAALLHMDCGVAEDEVFRVAATFHTDHPEAGKEVLIYDVAVLSKDVFASTSFYDDQVMIWRRQQSS
jgi:WD40 repeat protein